MVARTLIIDDYEPFVSGLQTVFAAEGIDLDVTTDWELGIRQFRVGSHELVVADYNLPGSDLGLKLLAAVKRIKPTTRLILISGVLSSDAASHLGKLTFVDRYLPKTGELPEILLEEARNAEERASASSDWPILASAFLDSLEMDDEEVERIDQVLRAVMRGER